MFLFSEGGSSDCAGLKEGDQILRVNGINVAGSGTDSIARVIRYLLLACIGLLISDLLSVIFECMLFSKIMFLSFMLQAFLQGLHH